jgi:hypothetical protein
MKHLLSYLISLLLLGIISWGCSDQQAPTANTDEAITPLSKVTVDEYSFDYELNEEDIYDNCANGQPMQPHGWLRYHVRETTTPSGNILLSAWVDFNALGGVTLENVGTGEMWTLTNGNSPITNVTKENGFYVAAYHWNELYRLNNQNFHIHAQGHKKFEPDGTVTTDRRSYNCF